jgi:hypothetical protein
MKFLFDGTFPIKRFFSPGTETEKIGKQSVGRLFRRIRDEPIRHLDFQPAAGDNIASIFFIMNTFNPISSFKEMPS